jgi:hypothetical protein
VLILLKCLDSTRLYCNAMCCWVLFDLITRYAAIYFSILYVRYRAGIVTDEMLAVPKWRFLAIGILEALGVATGMSAGGIGIWILFGFCN